MLKFSFKQQVFTGATITLIFVLISAISSYVSIKSLTSSSEWVNHSNEVIHHSETSKAELLLAESSLRAYILTGDEHFIKTYHKSINLIHPYLKELKNLVSDNALQQKSVDTLEEYAILKLEEMKTVLQIAKEKGTAAAVIRIKNSNSELYKQKFIENSKKFTDYEIKLLNDRKVKNDIESKRTTLLVLISAVVILMLVIFLFNYIKRTFDQLEENEHKILATNKELSEISNENLNNNWLLSGADEINKSMRGHQKVEELSANIVSKICTYVHAEIGVLFLKDEYKDQYNLSGAYAYPKNNKKSIAYGEGLVGQVALNQSPEFITNIPENFAKINSALGEVSPRFLYISPVIFQDHTLAVLEFGFLNEPEKRALDLIDMVTKNIGIALNSAISHVQLQHLFEQTQQQAEELASQQEELRTTNEELIHKTEALQASEEELRVQQEELQQANTELEEKASQLEEKNAAINLAKEAIILKAEELEASSKYKSEFLANMSHELRTPLNSILILARILKDNRPDNLTEDQIKYAGVIFNAGSDLLTLINDILDLSKIESGNVDLHIENIKFASVQHNIESLFSEVAISKKINFNISLQENLPAQFSTDQVRLEQIIKNLLGNAFKFTPKDGHITLQIGVADKQNIKNKNLAEQTQAPLYFSVKDSGIGITADKQQVIFEAFQQADGSTSRKYGGTGLGLSICRELSQILGGEIHLESELGLGSTFTLFIPQNLIQIEEKKSILSHFSSTEEVTNEIAPLEIIKPLSTSNGNRLLIVEDDEVFADVLKDYAIEKGFQPILAHAGDEALEMATRLLPDAIVLDIMLPVMDGWAVLKQLKANPATAYIPVHMMSAGQEKKTKAKNEGAIGFLRKPVDKEKLDEAFDLLLNQHQYVFNKVLIIEDQILQSNTLTEQLIKGGAKVSQAYTGFEALEMLRNQDFDCIILDLKLPDISGFDLLDKIKSDPEISSIPVIINTAMELDKVQVAKIMKYSDAMVLKSSKSNDRLLDEVSLFMNKLQKPIITSQSGFSNANKNVTKMVSTKEKALKNKTILIADDDMRNIFALSSALQEYELNIHIANNGKEAIHQLHQNKDIDLVLMDIMMPEMDGYEAMRNIRLDKQYAKLPIIALTAKAMKNDREKCIEAGANDYISKPVDIDQLLSLIRVWLS